MIEVVFLLNSDRRNRVAQITILFFLLTMDAAVESALSPSLKQRYQKISTASESYGSNGAAVLQAAYSTLLAGNYKFVGLEDLWTTALQEGENLFSGNPWRMTGPERTKDMLGQTTIGPWQITIQNALEFGRKYGLKNAKDLVNDPSLQARIAADFIEQAYAKYGERHPLAIQQYFWLEGFLQKQIGQGPWYESVLPGRGRTQQQTGFYAKQILLGSRFNRKGLLYWLHVTGDDDAIRAALIVWKQAQYPIHSDDLPHCDCDPLFQQFLAGLL